MGRAVRVLVVDDVPDVADSLGVLLEALGYVVCAAYSGISALELAGEYRPDVVIMDIDMLGLDGLQTARRLRNDRRLRRLMFIAHTATDTPLVRRVAAHIGFAHFVRKGDVECLLNILKGLASATADRTGRSTER
jgi:CheY-like chemotaxis protein